MTAVVVVMGVGLIAAWLELNVNEEFIEARHMEVVLYVVVDFVVL